MQSELATLNRHKIRNGCEDDSPGKNASGFCGNGSDAAIKLEGEIVRARIDAGRKAMVWFVTSPQG